MEEVRSFGYICPKCGKAVLGSRSAFALQAAAVRIGCECGESELEIQTDGVKFRLWVPCGLCGGADGRAHGFYRAKADIIALGVVSVVALALFFGNRHCHSSSLSSGMISSVKSKMSMTGGCGAKAW